MRDKRGLPSRLWDTISAADTWSWLWGILPKPAREWLARNLWGPILAVVGTLLVIALGWLRSIEPFYLTVSAAVVFSALLYAGSWMQRSVGRWRANRRPFVIRPISGSISGLSHIMRGDASPFAPRVLFAELEIESRRFLRDCTVTVVSVEEIERHLRHLHRHAGGPFELAWSSAGDRKRDLTPGVPRRINVARFDQNERYFQVASNDGGAPPKYLSGWYKVTILVASESMDSAVQTFEGKIALGRREGVPPPLAFWDWQEGDERRVEFEGIEEPRYPAAKSVRARKPETWRSAW